VWLLRVVGQGVSACQHTQQHSHPAKQLRSSFRLHVPCMPVDLRSGTCCICNGITALHCSCCIVPKLHKAPLTPNCMRLFGMSRCESSCPAEHGASTSTVQPRGSFPTQQLCAARAGGSSSTAATHAVHTQRSRRASHPPADADRHRLPATETNRRE
jgi:hypothetical protein